MVATWILMPTSWMPASWHSAFIRLLALMPRPEALGYMMSCKERMPRFDSCST